MYKFGQGLILWGRVQSVEFLLLDLKLISIIFISTKPGATSVTMSWKFHIISDPTSIHLDICKQLLELCQLQSLIVIVLALSVRLSACLSVRFFDMYEGRSKSSKPLHERGSSGKIFC